MKKWILARLMFLMGCSAAAKPARWEHGWKTKYVVATRYQSPVFGFNAGFTFPLNSNDCDRVEIIELIQRHGGAVFSAGGYLGAPVYAVFDGIDSKDKLDKKIQEVIPDLDHLMRTF